MANIALPVAFEFITGPFGAGAFSPGVATNGTGYWVGSAPYLSDPDDGSYSEDLEFLEGVDGDLSNTQAGIAIDTPWVGPPNVVDIAVDWRIFVEDPPVEVFTFFYSQWGSALNGYASTSFADAGWHTGTSRLSESTAASQPNFIAEFLQGGDDGPGWSAIMVRPGVAYTGGDLPVGYTYRVDYIYPYVITEGGTPLRLMQRGDGLGMGSGHILGTNTRQSSTRLFGAL